MSDRFDELLDPGKAKGLRKELARLYPPRGTGIVPPGTVYAYAEPRFVGRMPTRCDLKVNDGSNRLKTAQARILATHQACRENKNPPIDPEALSILQAVTGTDTMRVYQLAEAVVTEVYLRACNDVEAAKVVADNWVRVVAWLGSVMPLAETGMYPPKHTATQWPGKKNEP